MGRANGVTRDEIVEIVIQPAFYTGWPRARAVFAQVGEVWPGRPRGGRDDIGPELSQFSDPGCSRLLLWCRGLCGVGR